MIARRTFALGTLALATLIGLAGSLPALADDSADRVKLRHTLMQAEAASWEWVRTKNVAALQDYFADDALLIFCDGSRYGKAEFLKALPGISIDTIVIDKATSGVIAISPDVATLLYKVSYKSGNTTCKAASASTYVRRNGKWLSVLYQETPVK